MKFAPVRERFWSKVDRSGGPDSCWPWLARRSPKDYGVFTVSHDKPAMAHAFAWRDTYQGPVHPNAADFRHFCDNPPCCNPAHSYPGTNAENVRDMVTKGRQARGDRSGARKHPESRPRGDRHGIAKLREIQIPEIRHRLRSGESTASIARSVGVSKMTICNVHLNRTWRHVS